MSGPVRAWSRRRTGTVPPPAQGHALSQESRRWLETAEQAKTILAPASTITVTSDRKGDIFPGWATIPEDRCHLLVRAMPAPAKAGGGSPAGGRWHSVRRGGPVQAGRTAQGRNTATCGGPNKAHGRGGVTIWRGDGPPAAGRKRPRSAENRHLAADRRGGDRAVRGSGTVALAVTDHASGPRCLKRLGVRGLGIECVGSSSKCTES
jgi:hypothetical protein